MHRFGGWDGSIDVAGLWLGGQKNVFGESEWATKQDKWKKSMQGSVEFTWWDHGEGNAEKWQKNNVGYVSDKLHQGEGDDNQICC